jgi:penicillin-binding protein 1A
MSDEPIETGNIERPRRFKRPYLIAASVLGLLFVVAVIKTYHVYQYELPTIEEVYNIEPALKTVIYASDGTPLKEFYNQNRALTPFDKMPKHMVQMLMAVEDQRFYDHWGINVRRVFVVALTNIFKMRIEGGASTITQQLARMLFLTRRQTFDRKIKEALTAIKLERTYSKNEILEMYLNLYYFHRAYGVSAAAHAFFNKDVSELSVSDCAVLFGMLRGPITNSPFTSPEKSLQARNRVLYAYYKFGGISEQEFDSLKALPLEIHPPAEEPGSAPYFTEYIRQYIEEKYGVDKLYNGGLKVYTTLDWQLQQATEEAVAKQTDSLQQLVQSWHSINNPNYTVVRTDTLDDLGHPVRAYKQIQAAAVTIDNKTGDVLAMVGGRNFDQTKFNRAIQALRQPGSSFKPFVYTAAMDNGWTPDSILYDNSVVLDIPGSKEWRPKNFDDTYMGRMTVREGLKLSRNMIAIKLILKIKPELAVFYAHQMGIQSELRPVPSLAIGTSEVRVEEITSAYTVFPNGGIRIPPRHIIKIVDRYGNILEENSSIQKDEVLSEETAYIMVNMLQSVMEPGGTGYGARWRGFTRPAGGKTGTSDNFCDNWFIGFTPQITTGVWVGFDDKTQIGDNMTGSANALPIWTQIMLAAHQDKPIEDFEVPAGIYFAEVCDETGLIASPYCPKVTKEVFTVKTLPKDTCSIHNNGSYRSVRRAPIDSGGTTRF